LDNCIDKELVIRLRQGDIKSFDAIYLKYHRPLYLNISKLTKDPEVVQDILQEVFITLWEKRLSLDENKPVANWLFTVSYNKSITWLKNSLRESTRVSFLYGDTQEPDKNESSIREMRLCQIESAVQQLSPQKIRSLFSANFREKLMTKRQRSLKFLNIQ
jgi:RNA polymerase sigma-70 factor (ECF subfamily)